MGKQCSTTIMCAVTMAVAVANYLLNDEGLNNVLKLLLSIMVVMIYHANYKEK